MDDLDHYLLHHLNVSKRRLKNIKRLKKIIYDPVGLSMVEHRAMGMINFYETMILDKSLLKKKRHRINEKSEDVLARTTIETYFRHLTVATIYFYTICSGYLMFWRRR